jgi:HPr kinase/phosphorylase
MPATVSVQEILDSAEKDLGLHLLAGREGLTNTVSVLRVQKPGLALAGFRDFIQPERVQILGRAEISYLKLLPTKRRREVIDALCGLPLACILITYNLRPPRRLVEACNAQRIPLLRASTLSERLVVRLTRFLEEKLSERTRVHGVLVDVYGVGVLLRGKSGIGKSEAALDLVARGHRLVADDLVEIRKVAHRRLLGTSNQSLGFHMEIRGLGIINVLDLFGTTSTRERIPIDLVVHLVEWAELPNPDRTGLNEETSQLLEVEIPLVHIPVRPGRNVATIVEVASRNEILRRRGTYSAQAFNEDVLQRLRVTTPELPRIGHPDSTQALSRLAKIEAGEVKRTRQKVSSRRGGRRERTAKNRKKGPRR